jgi:hypothetical protein
MMWKRCTSVARPSYRVSLSLVHCWQVNAMLLRLHLITLVNLFSFWKIMLETTYWIISYLLLQSHHLQWSNSSPIMQLIVQFFLFGEYCNFRLGYADVYAWSTEQKTGINFSDPRILFLSRSILISDVRLGLPSGLQFFRSGNFMRLLCLPSVIQILPI